MEADTIIFDSSVLVSFFNDKDSQHKDALRYSSEISKMEITPDFILQETATVLRNKKNNETSIFFVNLFTYNSSVKIMSFFDAHQVFFSEEFIKEENKNLSYIDASLLALHKTGKFKVITFDKNLKTLIDKFNKGRLKK